MYRQKKMEDFCLWIKENQLIINNNEQDNPKVEIKMIDDATGYGIFAKQDVNLGEILIKIPQRFIINAQFVTSIPEYSAIFKRYRFEPLEMLVLFFIFERLYFKYIKDEKYSDKSSTDLLSDIIKSKFGKSYEFLNFLQSRMKRINNSEITQADTIELPWWKTYMDILPCEFGTPLFKYYLLENGEEKLRKFAVQLPQQAKEKLIEQMIELQLLEQKLKIMLFEQPDEYQEDVDRFITTNTEDLVQMTINTERKEISLKDDFLPFWRENCCWAWHIVNTRCIYVDNLPIHFLIDAFSYENIDDGDKIKSNHKLSMYSNQGSSDKKNTRYNEEYGGSIALIPLVDMLNHDPHRQCIPTFDKATNSYIVTAEHHALRQGEQLFVCYGTHDNVQLWIDYGFRIENNPFNKVIIPIELFIALAEKCGVRVNINRRQILAKADLPCTIYATDDLPSYGLRKNCTILLMPKEKLTNWSRYIFFENNTYELEEANSPEMQLMRKILERLTKALQVRKDECVNDEARTFWFDQIQILQKLLKNIG